VNVQAVILAGGAGKRTFPLGLKRPKSMFEIMGKPLIQYVIENLTQAGIRDVIIVTNPDQQEIQEYFGDGESFGLTVRYAFQTEPLGQAHALQMAERWIEDRVLVLNANDVYEPTLVQDVMAKMEATGSEMVLVGKRVDDPWRFGVLRFDDDGRLAGVVEKPPRGTEPSDMAVLGIYLFSRRIFDCIRKTPRGDTDDQLERAYQKLIDEGLGTFIQYDGTFESYKYPWNLLRICDVLLERHISDTYISPTARVHGSVVLDGPVVIEDGARIFEHAVIRGPAYIGPGTIVGNNVLIRGGVSIGRNTIVGYGTEVKHSVVGNFCEMHIAYVGDSIISDRCALGAGTITANLRLDREPVQVRVGREGEQVSSGTPYLGVIMAENCRTGCNATLMPGVKIGPDSVVGPGVVLTRDLPPGRAALLGKGSYEVRDNRLVVE